MPFRRSRFSDVVSRQLDLFVEEHAELLRECEEALARYNAAGRDEAEELYGDYVDVVETGTEALADMRDAFARTLGDEEVERYESEFQRAVEKRLRPFALELENR
jgi:hypothetical protein